MDYEKLKRDIETLKTSIDLDTKELASLSPEERGSVRRHIQWCIDELKILYEMAGEKDSIK